MCDCDAKLKTGREHEDWRPTVLLEQNRLGEDNISNLKTKTSTSDKIAWSVEVLSTSGKHMTLQPQVKWAPSHSIFISRIRSFRAFQGVRALATKQSVYCCWQDQISLTSKFLDTKWHYVYIYTCIWPEPVSLQYKLLSQFWSSCWGHI